MVFSKSFLEGSLGARIKWMRTSSAPSWPLIRNTQLPMTESDDDNGKIQETALAKMSITSTAHLKGRRLLVLTSGRRLHAVQIQRFQNPRGKIGIQNR